MPRSATANIDVDTGIPVGAAGPRKRWYHFDNFNKKPNKDAAFTIGTTNGGDRADDIEEMIEANEYWELEGADARYVDISFATGGGINLKTHTTTTDQAALFPLTVADYATGMNAVLFDTTKQPAAEFGITTSNDIGSQKMCAGFIVAHAEAYAVGGDNDRIVLEYVAGANSGNFMIQYSTDTADGSTVVDYEIDTGIANKISTAYWFKIAIDQSRFGNVWIGESSDPGSAKHFVTKYPMKSVTTLKPYVLIETAEEAENNIDVNYIALGRDR